MANLDAYIRPNSIGVLMVQMDEDDSGTVSTAEILAYINGEGQFHGQNFFAHINNVVPPMIMTAANIDPFDVNHNGEFDQLELLTLFHSLMMHLAYTNSPTDAINAFHGYQLMITAFNNRFDGAPPVVVPPAPPAPPAPVVGHETCPICLDDFDDNRQARKCIQCNAWFHTTCIAGICNAQGHARLCPNCRTPWPQNCAGLRTRNGPVITGALAGGNRSCGNKRKSHKRKSHKRKSHKRKTHKRKTHKRKTTR